MPPLRDDLLSRPALGALIAAFADPGAVDPGLAAQVLSDARELLRQDVETALMPALMLARSAVLEAPEAPTVPSGAI